jgi:hypothetical protein
MNEKFTPVYQRDMERILDFALHKSTNPLINKTHLEPWDMRFYMREMSEVYVNVNEINELI